MSLIVTSPPVAIVITDIDASDGLRSPDSQRVTVDVGTPMLAAKCEGIIFFFSRYRARVMLACCHKATPASTQLNSQIPLAIGFAMWQCTVLAADHGAAAGDRTMGINVNFHSDIETKFEANFISMKSRLIRATSKSGECDLWLSDAQARDLAETILAALAATAAKKSEAA